MKIILNCTGTKVDWRTGEEMVGAVREVLGKPLVAWVLEEIEHALGPRDAGVTVIVLALAEHEDREGEGVIGVVRRVCRWPVRGVVMRGGKGELETVLVCRELLDPEESVLMVTGGWLGARWTLHQRGRREAGAVVVVDGKRERLLGRIWFARAADFLMVADRVLAMRARAAATELGGDAAEWREGWHMEGERIPAVEWGHELIVSWQMFDYGEGPESLRPRPRRGGGGRLWECLAEYHRRGWPVSVCVAGPGELDGL